MANPSSSGAASGSQNEYDHSAQARGYHGGGEPSYDRWASSTTMAQQSPGSGPVPGPYVGRGPRGYKRPDDRIREDVCERLTEHGQVDASDIEIKVDNAEVTLTGNVVSRQAKRTA